MIRKAGMGTMALSSRAASPSISNRIFLRKGTLVMAESALRSSMVSVAVVQVDIFELLVNETPTAMVRNAD
jgi:hypothetical protein